MEPPRPRPAASRPELLGWTVVLLGLSTPVSLSLLVLSLVSIPLIGVFGAGIPLALGLVWLTRAHADLHRWLFARAVGVTIPRPYRPWPGAVSWTVTSPADARAVLRKLPALARDPATWRDLLWLLLNSTAGLAAYLLGFAFAAGALWFGFLPALWWILAAAGGPALAESVLRTDFGLWAIDSQTTALAAVPIAALFLALWWWLSRPLLRGYARLAGRLLGPTRAAALAARIRELTASRAETVDAQSAELRRIERDLHDGAQARLVSLGMSLGMAEQLLASDPRAAARLLAEAREDTTTALAELRSLVRGMHPPVLSDRGLPGAVRALAIAHPLPVAVDDQLPPGRLPPPVESAAYFSIAEALTNVTKHARASTGSVALRYERGRLRATIRDDGRGGAAIAGGSGLPGIRRRLAAFDGTVEFTSPPGGPTVVTLEIPCELYSVRTTPSSGTG